MLSIQAFHHTSTAQALRRSRGRQRAAKEKVFVSSKKFRVPEGVSVHDVRNKDRLRYASCEIFDAFVGVTSFEGFVIPVLLKEKLKLGTRCRQVFSPA